MTNLPWLIQAAGPEPARRRAQRTREASRDLAAFADRIRDKGLHLVLEDAVDIAFEFNARDLPPGAVDARGYDAVGIALDDPSAVLITADGFYIGLAIARDSRWDRLAALGRSRGRLGSNALSGWYYGLVVDGPEAGRFRDGVREEFVAVEAELVYGDGSVAVIERTTLAHVVHQSGRTIRFGSLVEAIRWSERLPIQVTSDRHTDRELATLLTEADRMIPPELILNGRRWRGPGTVEDGII